MIANNPSLIYSKKNAKKNSSTFFIGVFFTLVFFLTNNVSDALADPVVNCVCSRGSSIPLVYPQDAGYVTTDAALCKTTCMKLEGAKYYSFSAISIFTIYSRIYNCLCVNGSIIPFYYPEDTKKFDVANDDACNQKCANRGTKYYSYSNLANLGTTRVTKKPTITPPKISNLNYEPMEVIPGFAKTNDFAVFISNLYKFGIWTVGISALVMIVIGGYMYAASGGNNASMEKAKGFITDALAGLILALLAYLILYIINPELVKIKMGSATSSATSTSTQTSTTSGLAANPNNLKCIYNTIDQTKLNVCSEQKRPGGCGNSLCETYKTAIEAYAQGAATISVLKTFMVIESDCNIKAHTATSYGLMQITPNTVDATMKVGCSVTEKIDGDWLMDGKNATKSICLAARIINKYAVICGNQPKDIYAAYNAGPGNCVNSGDCRNDQSCSGGVMKKWECPFDNNKTICNEGMQETRQGATYVNYCLNHLSF